MIYEYGVSMRNNLLMLIALMMATSISSAASAAPASVSGIWKTADKDALVTIRKCGNSLCGRITKFLVPPPDGVGQKDVNNPNKNLRNRTLLGLDFLTEFKADGKKWKGRIYDPKSGKTYKSVLYKAKDGRLVVKGCVLFICQTQRWTAQ